MQRLIRFAAVPVLVLSLGLHWALLQSVAWTGMMITYSRGASLAEAFAKTFGGDHPCCLCETIQQSRAAEKKEPHTVTVLSKLDPGIVWQTVLLDLPHASNPISSPQNPPRSRVEPPPAPPPRVSSDRLG